MNRKKYAVRLQKGFTLVELLVVVAIIGVLSALIMTNLVGIRQRARDAQRKSDMRQIQSSLELYRSDAGSYPVTASFPSCGSSLSNGATVYMKTVPCDPIGSSYYNSGAYYYSSSDGSTYVLAGCLENASDTDKNNTNTSPGGSGTCTSGVYFQVTNP